MDSASGAVRTIDCDYTGRPRIAAAYLIRDGDRAAFVETNTTSAVPRLLAALREEGMVPAQVQYVIVTHIHLDHAGGAGALMAACPNATLLAHPRAAPHAIDPTRIVEGAAAVYGEARAAELYGEVLPTPASRVRTVDDGAVVWLGSRMLTFLHTRGHANHHFCVHDERARGVFTGDSFGILYPDLQRNGLFVFPSTTPTDFDAEAAHVTVDRIVETGAVRVFPTHFGEHPDPAAARDPLHRQIDAYGALVDEADASGRTGEVLDRFCLERVTALFDEELQRHGLAGDSDAAAMVGLDIPLNADGIAFAVRKRRYKRDGG